MLNKNDKLEFALVSDLTTFIEVGDLILRVNRLGRFMWLIIELKPSISKNDFSIVLSVRDSRQQ